MSEVLRLRVIGTPWDSGDQIIKQRLLQLDGVEGVTLSRQASLVGVAFDARKVTPELLKEKVEALGYMVESQK